MRYAICQSLFFSFRPWALGLHCVSMIDILFYIIIMLAIIHGWRKGLILALFSTVCGLIGLAAAVKLSAVIAMHMKSDLHITSRWLPLIAFILVFVLVIVVIMWAAGVLDKLIKWVLLEWLNKLGGILLFLLLYLSVYSVILFYGTRTHIISKQAVEQSHDYSLIAPFGPAVIRFITGFLPFGQDMFKALEGFFDKIANEIH
jgi:membrane protein required for colicin V production